MNMKMLMRMDVNINMGMHLNMNMSSRKNNVGVILHLTAALHQKIWSLIILALDCGFNNGEKCKMTSGTDT